MYPVKSDKKFQKKTNPVNPAFQDLFKCQMCREYTGRPHYFPCGDIICRKCFTDFVDDVDEDTQTITTDDTYLDCPICKQRRVVPRNRLTELVMGVFRDMNLSHLVEPSKKLPIGSMHTLRVRNEEFIQSHQGHQQFNADCMICGMNPNVPDSKASSQCLDCLDMLCDDCAEVHCRTRYTNTHIVMTLSELRTGQFDEQRKKRYRLTCLKHPGRALEVFCMPCNELLCLQCKLIDHNNHFCSDINPAAAGHRTKLATDLQDINKKVKTLEGQLKECSRRSKDAKKRRAGITESLISRLSYFKSQMEAYCEQLNTDSEEHFKKFLNLLQKDEDKLHQHLNKLVSMKLLTERLIEKATDVEMLVSKVQYAQKFKEYVTWEEPPLTKVKNLYLSIPKVSHQSVGILFGHLSFEFKDETENEYEFLKLTGVLKPWYVDDDGKLPTVSLSGRIYAAEAQIITKAADKAVGVKKSDFKETLKYVKSDQNTVELGLSTLVLSRPVCTMKLKTSHVNSSVIKLAITSKNEIVIALFFRNYDFTQIRQNYRVRIRMYEMNGEMKFDVPYGAVIYGLCIGPHDEIICSGGQMDGKTVDIFYKTGQESLKLSTRTNPGGVTVNTKQQIVVAGSIDIEFYTMDGQFVHSFKDTKESGGPSDPILRYENVRKEIVCCRSVPVKYFISDPSSNSIRGYYEDGSLVFEYGHFGGGTLDVIQPRGITVDDFNHIMVADIKSDTVQVLSETGGMICKLLEDQIEQPRCVGCFNGCHIAVGQNDGWLKLYRYMFDRDSLRSESQEEADNAASGSASHTKHSNQTRKTFAE